MQRVGRPCWVPFTFSNKVAMLRGFIDSTGVEWRVWEVFPSRTDSGAGVLTMSTLKTTPFAQGWLCFESTAEKRRLAPIPSGWESQDPGRLEDLCAQATVVPVRRHFGELRRSAS